MNHKEAQPATLLTGPVLWFLFGSALLWTLCLLVVRFHHGNIVAGDFYVHFFRRYQDCWDFRVYSLRMPVLHTPAFFSFDQRYGFPWQYPAPVAFLYKLNYLPPTHALKLFFLIVGLPVLWLAVLLGRRLVAYRVPPVQVITVLAVSLLLSYPFWFEYRLGNVEIWVFLLNAFGVLLFLRNRTYAAAVLFGLSAGFKVFPIVYLGLLLAKKQYRQVIVGVAVAVVFNVFALWWMGPTFSMAYHGVQAGLAYNRVHYQLHWLPLETGFDHTIIGFIKMSLRVRKGESIPSMLVSAYLLIAGCAGVALYFLRIRFLPVINQILCLCLASIWLTPNSHDYTLIHLYIPWGLLLLCCARPAFVKANTATLTKLFVCFAIVFSAEYEVLMKTVAVGGQIKCIALGVMFYLALRYPLAPVVQDPALPALEPFGLGSAEGTGLHSAIASI